MTFTAFYGNALTVFQADVRTFVMHASGFVLLSLVQEDRSGAYTVPFFSDCPSDSGYPVPSERSQVFFRMPELTAFCPPAGEFLSLLYPPITHIHVLCVVELFEDMFIPAVLSQTVSLCLWRGWKLPMTKASFACVYIYAGILPHGLCQATICHMDGEPRSRPSGLL